MLNLPIHIRIEEFAKDLLNPISNKTCDGFGDEEVHAEPDEIATLGKDAMMD